MTVLTTSFLRTAMSFRAQRHVIPAYRHVIPSTARNLPDSLYTLRRGRFLAALGMTVGVARDHTIECGTMDSRTSASDDDARTAPNPDLEV